MKNCSGCNILGCYLVINDALAMSSIRKNCPCLNCLVKMMCVTKCEERIGYYRTLYPEANLRMSDYAKELRNGTL